MEIQVLKPLLDLAIFLFLTLLIAFFVAAELALISASKEKMYRLAQGSSDRQQADMAKLVLIARENLPHYLSVTQTGTTAGSLILGAYGEKTTVHLLEPWINILPIHKFFVMVSAHSIAVTLAFILVTYIEIALGELIPKVLATQAPDRTALMLIRPLKICSYIFWPLLLILNGTVQIFTGFMLKKNTEELPQNIVNNFIPKDSHSVVISGLVDIATINEILGLNIPSHPAYCTIGGFMINTLGRLPRSGEIMLWRELELQAVNLISDRLETILLRQVTRPLLKQSPSFQHKLINF